MVLLCMLNFISFLSRSLRNERTLRSFIQTSPKKHIPVYRVHFTDLLMLISYRMSQFSWTMSRMDKAPFSPKKVFFFHMKVEATGHLCSLVCFFMKYHTKYKHICPEISYLKFSSPLLPWKRKVDFHIFGIQIESILIISLTTSFHSNCYA